MSLKVSLFHQTNYYYNRLVHLSPHLFRLKPAAHSRTPVGAYKLIINPATHIIHTHQDPFGNFLARVDFQGPMMQMTVEVSMVADLTPINPFNFFITEYAQNFPFAYDSQLKQDLRPYLEVEAPGPNLQNLLNQIDKTPRSTIDYLIKLNQKIFERINYTERYEPGILTSEEMLVKTLGSCRDSAWLLVQIMRNVGLAARFVSGYLVQLAPETPVQDPLAPAPADTLALHAWAEVYIPGAGWIGLDATSGLLAGEGHIPLACTPYPESAAPVEGTTDVCETTFNYVSKVSRLI